MSQKFVVEFRGKRTTVNVTPMAPLQKVIEEFSLQQKVHLDAHSCRLYYQKKLLDPTTPVRFANLPKEAKLELIADGSERRLGLADNATASRPAQDSAAIPALRPSTAAEAVLPSACLQPTQTENSIAPLDTNQSAPSGAAAVAPSQDTAAAQFPSQLPGAASVATRTTTDVAPASGRNVQSASASTRVPTIAAANGAQRPTDISSGPQHPQLDRQIHVFTREAAAAAESNSRGGTDLPDDFYDFTPDDYQKVMSSWARKNSMASGPLKTQKLREQDERRRAEQIGPVPVRIHFPDNSIIQAEFKPLETLAAIHHLICQCAQSSVPKWHMYVTPPKQILKDHGLTLYKAGLVPAANVLVGVEGQHQGSFLQPHIAAMQAAPPARSTANLESKSNAESDASAPRTSGASGSQFLPSSKAAGSGEKKVPKWMKLGK